MNTLLKLSKPELIDVENNVYSSGNKHDNAITFHQAATLQGKFADCKIIEKIALTKDLKQKLRDISKFSATSDVRYFLNGVFYNFNGDIVAADGFRILKGKHEKLNGDKGYILPINLVKLLLKLPIWDCEHFLHVDSDKGLLIQVGDGVIFSSAVDGKFPDYERVLEPASESIATFTLDKPTMKALKDSAKLATAFNPTFKRYGIAKLNGEISVPHGDGKWESIPYSHNSEYIYETGINVKLISGFPVAHDHDFTLRGFINDDETEVKQIYFTNADYVGVLMPARL